MWLKQTYAIPKFTKNGLYKPSKMGGYYCFNHIIVIPYDSDRDF